MRRNGQIPAVRLAPRTPPGLSSVTESICVAMKLPHGSGKLLEDRVSFAIGDGDGDLYISQS